MRDTENPITCLLKNRGRFDEATFTFWALFVSISFLSAPLNDIGLALGAAAGGLAYGLVRASRDGGHLTSWRKGRRLEEMLLSNLTPTDIVDGLVAYSLGRTRIVAGVIGLVNLGLGLGCHSPGYLWAALWGPALLLAMVFALVATAAGSCPCSPLLLAFWVPAAISPTWTWPCYMVAALVMAGWAAREAAGRNLLQEESQAPAPPRREVPCGPCLEARLWSDNPIVVRELRREARSAGASRWSLLAGRHGGFLLMLLLLFANLSRGSWNPARLQLNACYIAVALLALQSLRAALATSAAVVQEREAGTLETLALSGLPARAFVDGWAQLSWRPRLLEIAVAAPIALVLALWGVHLVPPVPQECSRYPEPLFATLWAAAGFVLPLVGAAATFSVALPYLGLLCSARAQNQGEAAGSTLFLFLALGVGLVWVGSLWGWVSLWWLCLAGIFTGGLCRFLILAQLKQ